MSGLWRLAFEDEQGVVARQYECEARPPLYATILLVMHDQPEAFPRENDGRSIADVQAVFVGKEYERASISSQPDGSPVQRGAVYRPRAPRGD